MGKNTELKKDGNFRHVTHDLIDMMLIYNRGFLAIARGDLLAFSPYLRLTLESMQVCLACLTCKEVMNAWEDLYEISQSRDSARRKKSFRNFKSALLIWWTKGGKEAFNKAFPNSPWDLHELASIETLHPGWDFKVVLIAQRNHELRGKLKMKYRIKFVENAELFDCVNRDFQNWLLDFFDEEAGLR